MKCNNCGTENSGESKFCINCGSVLSGEQQETNQQAGEQWTGEQTGTTGQGAWNQAAGNQSYGQGQTGYGQQTPPPYSGYQQPYQPYQQPVTQIPEEYTPISMWGYFGYQILFSIPCVGFIMLLIFSFGGTKNQNLKNYARSYFCFMIIMAVLLGFFTVTGGLSALVYSM